MIIIDVERIINPNQPAVLNINVRREDETKRNLL